MFFNDSKNRIVQQTKINDIDVSTVFVGVGDVVFETIVFGGKHDNYQLRYKTWDEAVKGHHRACEMVLNTN